jgi:AraC-like DNA-binding protein
VVAVQVAMPHDARAQRIAEALAANPADDRDLNTWGRQVGASARTLARVFVAETGLSFGRWRSQVRLRAAPSSTSPPACRYRRWVPRVGYHTPSAFVAAFRQAYGLTPGSYFDSTGRAPARAGARRSIATALLLAWSVSPAIAGAWSSSVLLMHCPSRNFERTWSALERGVRVPDPVAANAFWPCATRA